MENNIKSRLLISATSKKQIEKQYILVGLGPHAKRIYYPFLEKYQKKYGIKLRLLIELDSQQSSINKFIISRSLKPEEIFLIKDNIKNRLGRVLENNLLKRLDDLISKENIDGIIISTEPKSHKIYADWAMKNNINILMDKPITAPVDPITKPASARKIYSDYQDLKNRKQNSKSRFYIVCQRRNHKGFSLVKDYLQKFVDEFQIPISYIGIYHSDGTWNLPHEFEKENHPYKYGYGKLMHSGYHCVDLFAWISEVNNSLKDRKANSAKIYTSKFLPNDFFNQLNIKNYKNFFGNTEIQKFYENYDRNDYEKYGEIDAYILGQLMQDQNVITTASIILQQNTFSRRAWFDLPEDTYKGNGRLRHERVNIHVSQFLNIQIHSYQSYEAGHKDIDIEGVGNEDHFDIYIFLGTVK
ncbi:Gfo/Idh/MocA family oxidoreductase [Chryseobacterium sp. JUb7]|uniref:Gfo/Idh/MocA family oxidoreductase n=1 Tax=Chryseobacterium sp. JUb7 TaxID=2940599 RepID=UPI002167544B|nr:Gfo/Idh/MocA family oxidoreductase [Chryseobacterium sp. JUb7]MCS3531731.1 hypothetical protein [Chryseobacterium sp. JUb7]